MKRASIRVTASLLMSVTLLLPTGGSVAAHSTSYCGHSDKWDYGQPYGYNTYVDYRYHYNSYGHLNQYHHEVYDWWYNYIGTHQEANVCPS